MNANQNLDKADQAIVQARNAAAKEVYVPKNISQYDKRGETSKQGLSGK